MDPRHTLYKTLDNLSVDPNNQTPAGNMSAEADSSNQAASSGVTPEVIENKLRAVLGAEYVEIADLSVAIACIDSCLWGFSKVRIEVTRAKLIYNIGGCGQMYEAIIVSPQFAKKTTLARHRLVNSALKEEIAAIHAWTPKCHTPEEWEKKKPQ